MNNKKISKKIENQIEVITGSYDLSVELKKNKINPVNFLPQRFWSDPEFNNLLSCRFNSGMGDIRRYLKPKINEKYIDLGCYLNLCNYNLHKWPSKYYGVDSSIMVIDELKNFVKKNRIKIGGLYNSRIDALPFKDNYFQLATCLNVFEYYNLEYINIALAEIHRILDDSAKFIVDVPNIEHSSLPLAYKIEKFLGRPNLFKYPRNRFEKLLKNRFMIQKYDDSNLMVRYYLINSNK
jgi:SAM-dependent methyltransferase